MVEEHGYGVLTAASADEASALFAQQSGEIDLLVTDVIMPRRSGRDLYEVLAGEYPWLKVLYISGYADNAILHHGVLNAGAAFLHKPSTTEVLAQKAREVLDGVAQAAQ